MMVSMALLKSWARDRSLRLISSGILAVVSIFGCALTTHLLMITEDNKAQPIFWKPILAEKLFGCPKPVLDDMPLAPFNSADVPRKPV
jgi:hypothetical protein